MRILALVLVWAAMLSAQAPKVLVHGHRGARAMRPENTLPAFEYAIGVGVDVLELDMAVTRDNIVVISHDPYLAPPICTGPQSRAMIHELTFAQVREWDCGKTQNPRQPKQVAVPGTRMPTLDEVFALGAGSNVQYNIETKITPEHPELAPPPEEFARLVLEVIRKHKVEQRVILQSFDFRTLRAMKKLAPEIRLSALWEGSSARDFVSIAQEAGATIVSPMYSHVTPEKVRAAHAAGLEVVPWTANRPEDWDRLIAAQVDAIISDDPAALIAHLKTKELR
jgi:glycerophosphoryl diester phosphodiesterase